MTIEFSVYIVLFLIFSFLGFILDSSYCSLEHKRLVKSGYIPYLPLCPMYGFGGLLLFMVQKIFGFLPWYLLFTMEFLVVVLAELVGGIYCVFFLKERLWDYRNEKWNVRGHISFQHNLYWLLVVSLFIKVFFPFFNKIEVFLLEKINLGGINEFLILFTFIVVFVVLSHLEFKRRTRKRLRGQSS